MAPLVSFPDTQIFVMVPPALFMPFSAAGRLQGKTNPSQPPVVDDASVVLCLQVHESLKIHLSLLLGGGKEGREIQGSEEQPQLMGRGS